MYFEMGMHVQSLVANSCSISVYCLWQMHFCFRPGLCQFLEAALVFVWVPPPHTAKTIGHCDWVAWCPFVRLYPMGRTGPSSNLEDPIYPNPHGRIFVVAGGTEFEEGSGAVGVC